MTAATAAILYMMRQQEEEWRRAAAARAAAQAKAPAYEVYYDPVAIEVTTRPGAHLTPRVRTSTRTPAGGLATTAVVLGLVAAHLLTRRAARSR